MHVCSGIENTCRSTYYIYVILYIYIYTHTHTYTHIHTHIYTHMYIIVAVIVNTTKTKHSCNDAVTMPARQVADLMSDVYTQVSVSKIKSHLLA